MGRPDTPPRASSRSISQISSAFWKWSRLAAWGRIRLRGPSRIVGRSLPRRGGPAGNGGRSPRGGSSARSAALTWKGANTARRALGLVFLPHARPDVGVDHLRPLDGLARVVLDDQGMIGEGRLEPGAELGRELVAGGSGQDELEPEQGRGQGQRPRHVVAVADEDELDAFEPSERLPGSSACRPAPGRGGPGRRGR